jgi:hypothetical protein
MRRNRDGNGDGNSKLMQFMEDAELQIKAEQKRGCTPSNPAYSEIGMGVRFPCFHLPLCPIPTEKHKY